MTMTMKLKTLTTVLALSSLAACGGSGDSTDISNAPTDSTNLSNDAATASFIASSSLAGAPVGNAQYDLTITDVALSETLSDSGTATFSFGITDLSGAAVPTDNLSIALEIAGSGSFTDAYRTPLFDLRASDDSTGRFTARSAPVDLPGGSYQARLVVNPSWRYKFDVAPADHSHTSAFHYVGERDYRNNASAAFQAQVSSNTRCAEDGFENNDNHQSAQPVPPGSQIDAALCLDDMDLYSVQLGSADSASIAFHYTDPNASLNQASRYVVLDSALTPLSAPHTARDAHRIEIESTAAGTYYLALFGARSEYRLTRFAGTSGTDLANDFTDTSLFAGGSELLGPQSWLFGQVMLQKLAITEESMVNQTVNCGRITTQYQNGEPVAYVTPQHFADIHEFQFRRDGQYLLDADVQSGWTVANGDLAGPHWYNNDYPGYAERVSDDRWRYWTTDGLAYVECAIDLQ
jgi:hypothetical protein